MPFYCLMWSSVIFVAAALLLSTVWSHNYRMPQEPILWRRTILSGKQRLQRCRIRQQSRWESPTPSMKQRKSRMKRRNCTRIFRDQSPGSGALTGPVNGESSIWMELVWRLWLRSVLYGKCVFVIDRVISVLRWICIVLPRSIPAMAVAWQLTGDICEEALPGWDFSVMSSISRRHTTVSTDISDAKCAIVLVSSSNSTVHWKNTPGHYVDDLCL